VGVHQVGLQGNAADDRRTVTDVELFHIMGAVPRLIDDDVVQFNGAVGEFRCGKFEAPGYRSAHVVPSFDITVAVAVAGNLIFVDTHRLRRIHRHIRVGRVSGFQGRLCSGFHAFHDIIAGNAGGAAVG